MSNIPKVSLGELLTLERRPIKVIADEQYAEIGIYCFGRGIFHKTPRTGLEVGDKDLFLIKEGDFILQVTFAWEGAVALASSAEDGMYGSTRFPTFRVDESRCFPPYLLNFFRTPAGLEQLVKISPGSAGRNRVLSLKRIPEVFVPLPPLEEQRRIMAQVEELAGKIEEARSLRKQTLEDTKALRVSSNKAILTELAQAGTQPLRELVTVQGGGTPSKENPLFWNGLIPWVTPKDMKRREIYDSIDRISEEATLNSPAKLLQPGGVLIVVRGMILAHTVPSAVLRIPATINQDMKALMPSDKITSEYLCHVLWGLNYQLLELVEKSSHDTRKLETPKLLNFKIPVPPLSEQRRIVTYLDRLQTKVDEMKRMREQAIKELDALLPSILDKAFKGEL